MAEINFSVSGKEIKFSIFGKEKPIKYGALIFDKENLSTEQLNELFNNETVKNNVTDLALTNCNIEELPESIGNLTNLTALRLHDPEIDNNQRKNLSGLNGLSNSFKILPRSLVNLKNLEELRLEQFDKDDPDNNKSTDPDGYVTRTGINNDKHNMEILYAISKKRIGVRSYAKVTVNNYFGGLQLIKGRNQNKRRLLEANFKTLEEEYNINFETPLIKSSTQRSRSRQRSSARSTQSEPRTARTARRTRRRPYYSI
jgi:hypothetical protein